MQEDKDSVAWSIWEIKAFYKDAKARNTIPVKYQEAIEWFIDQLVDFS